MPNKSFDWSSVGGVRSKEDTSHKFDWSKFGGVETTSPKQRGIGKSLLRQAGRIGRIGATGIAEIADIPNLAALGLHAAGLKEEPTFYKPIASRIEETIDELTGDTLKPENKAEEYMDIIGKGLAPLALSPVTGGASLTGLAARGVAKKAGEGLLKKGAKKVVSLGSNPYKLTGSNIAGSAGTSAAIKAYSDENQGINPLGALAAGMVGGTAARGALKLRNPLNAAAEGVGKVTGFSPEKYAQQKALGLPVTPANVAKSKIHSYVPHYLEMIGSKIPGSMEPLEKFYQRRERGLARNLGVKYPEDLELTVKNIPKHLAKKGGEGYHARASKIYTKREEKFKTREDEAIKNRELVNVSDIINKLDSDRELLSTAASKKRFDRSPNGILLRELRESIPNDNSSTINSLKKQGYSDDLISKIVKENNSSQGIGLPELNELRQKALDESISLQKPLGGGTPASREASIRSEMLGSKRHQFMEEIGNPQEIHNAKQARKFWAQYKNEKNGTAKYVEKLTGSYDDAEAFKKLTTTNPKYIKIARQGLPKEDRPKLAQAIIADMGEKQGRFNIASAHTWYSKLEDPVKKEFLKTFGDKATQHNFEKAMKFIGDNKKVMEKFANTSNTAHTKQFMNIIKRGGAAASALLTAYDPHLLALLAASYAGLRGGATIWTSQKFMKRMNDVISAKNEKAQTNRLTLLFKTVNQIGRQSDHMEKNSH